MTERISLLEGLQIGVQTVRGTGVAAGKRLQALVITPTIKANTKTYQPMGSKFATKSALIQEWTESKVSGQPTFGEMVYLLSSVIKAVTPTRNIPSTGLSYTWEYEPDDTTEDTPALYTVEAGSGVRAHKFIDGVFTGMEMTFKRDGLDLTGTMMGMPLQDGITLTSTPTDLELVPVLPVQVSVYQASTAAGLAAASAMDRVMSASWGLTERYGPLWELNSAKNSYATMVEKKSKLGMKLKLEANSSGMANLTSLRQGDSTFLRIKAVGGLIETTYSYTLQIDMAAQVTNISDFSDQDGVYANEWEFTGKADATWGKALYVKVINQIAAL